MAKAHNAPQEKYPSKLVPVEQIPSRYGITSMSTEDLEEKIHELAWHHIDIDNNPYEPYTGVAALFNADLHTTTPGWAPREDWIVKSALEIVHVPIDANERLISPHDTAAKSEEIEAHWSREIGPDEPVPDDETRTHIFRDIIAKAQQGLEEEDPTAIGR